MAFVEPSPEQAPLDPHLERTLGELSQVLWRLRTLTSLLVYRLEVQQLVLVSGRNRWVNIATEDVDDAIEAIRHQEEERIRLVEHLGPLLDISPHATLRDLCESAPTPWDGILAEHQAEFLTLCAEAEDAARGNRELLHQGLSEVQQLFDSMRGRGPDVAGDGAYGSRSGSLSSPSSSVLVDREV